MDDSAGWNLVAENLPDIVVRVDRERRFQYLNRQWEIETGLERARCLGRTIHEIGMPAVLCDMLEFAFEQIMSTKSLYEFEHPFAGPRGQVYYWTRVVPEFDEAGEVKYCLAVVRNVTSRVEAEAKLAESEERFQAFMDHSPAFSWMKDENGRYVFISRVYEQRFQLDRKKVYGRTDEQVWPPHIAKIYRENDLAVLADGQTRELFEAGHNPDGSPCRLRVLKFLVKDALGRKYVGGTGIDVATGLERLESLSAELASILAGSSEAIVSTNREGVIQTWNSSARRMFGYQAEEIIGSSVLRLIPTELIGQELVNFGRVQQGERIQQTETVRLCRDQSPRVVSLTISPIPNADGTMVGSLHLFRESSMP